MFRNEKTNLFQTEIIFILVICYAITANSASVEFAEVE